MTEEEFINHFKENIQMVLGHEAACEWCLDFLCQNGLTPMTIKTLGGKYRYTNDVVEYLRTYYLRKEEYVKLGRLSRISSTSLPLSEVDLNNFNTHAKTVLSFEENCEVCWEVFEDEEMIPFYSFDAFGISMDYVTFMAILVNHFYDTDRNDRCILLTSLLEELKQDFPEGKHRDR